MSLILWMICIIRICLETPNIQKSPNWDIETLFFIYTFCSLYTLVFEQTFETFFHVCEILSSKCKCIKYIMRHDSQRWEFAKRKKSKKWLNVHCIVHSLTSVWMNYVKMNKNNNNVHFEFAALKYFASKSKLLRERNRNK